MLANLNLIKRKVEVSIDGLVNNQIFMKDNLKPEKEMEEVLSGGLMEAGMKDNSKKEYNVGKVYFIVKEEINNMKVAGRMVCSMVKVFNILIMDKDTKATSNKINSTETVYFIKMTQ
jgi:hypothetical protein